VRRKLTSKSFRRGGITRRKFIQYAGAAGLAAALPPGLISCGGNDERRSNGATEKRTLFFNFSHEPDASSATYFVVASPNRYRLRPVSEDPSILARERMNNAFLRSVPDSAITHLIDGMIVPLDAVQLCYVIKNPDTTSGTWSMSSMFFHLPSPAVLAAPQRSQSTADGLLPLSLKRKKYGAPPAASAEELLEEHSLKDTTDHASTLVAVHPDILSAEPNSAAHIFTNKIATNGELTALEDILAGLGPAKPDGSGWAMLKPFTDDNETALRSTSGSNRGLILYDQSWHPAVATLAVSIMGPVIGAVKDDTTLGADVTATLQNVGDGETPSVPAGVMWFRRDGIPNIDQSPPSGTIAQSSVGTSTTQYILTPRSPYSGCHCKGRFTENNGGTPRIELDVENTYVRWLSTFVEFLDSEGNSKKADGFPYFFGQDRYAFLGMISPEFTIYGIPVESSVLKAEFDFPVSVASSANIFASGIGTGSHVATDTEHLGILFTSVFNLAVPPIMIAAAAGGVMGSFYSKVVGLAVATETGFVQTAADTIVGIFKGNLTFDQVKKVLVRAIISAATAPPFLATVAGLVLAQIAFAAVQDAIPVVGAIFAAIGATVAAETLALTIGEITRSPFSYQYKLVLKHDLRITFLPDEKDDTTPKAANLCVVTAHFDSDQGTPVVQSIPLELGGRDSLTVTFQEVPLGGQVNISAGFYQVESNPDQPHILLGKVTTGLVPNTTDDLGRIRITEILFPIGPQTQYAHAKKTTLDDNGNHVWERTEVAPTAKATDVSNSCSDEAESLCEFRDITVRQGTAEAKGYLGYAWKSFSSGLSSCESSGKGQLDQFANVNTADDAGDGYFHAPCGLQSGTKLAYNLLSHGTANFYLDSRNQIIRRVQLDPTPAVDDPHGNMAWGKLNLPSTALLLHPSGRFVSINAENNLFETLAIPLAPVPDDEAAVKLLALRHSGPGTRPGLMMNPVAAAISAQGVILVLEQGENNRIQALDTGANPVGLFTKQPTPYFLSLDATKGGNTTYLDIAVEFGGFIYVLSFNKQTNLYRMDLYHPDQSGTDPIATTTDVNADKLTVDYWRNVYTLNYELLKLPNGTVPPISEPSVSLWVPTNNGFEGLSAPA